MNMLVFLQEGAAPAGPLGGSGFLIVMLLIFVVMWFFMIRPQQKKQKEIVNFRNSLQKGDRIVTIGGIYGKVLEVNDNTLMIEIDNNVKIKVDKSSVVKDVSDIQR